MINAVLASTHFVDRVGVDFVSHRSKQQAKDDRTRTVNSARKRNLGKGEFRDESLS